ncbi:MAG TPA: MCE family protein, partial [Actinopolymorphaceae bacterium]
MGRRGRTRAVVRRGLGLTFLVGLVLLAWLTYASFTKVFVPVEWVTVRTSHIGLQLNEHADVKLRGVIVGEVREVAVDDGGARLELAMDPEAMKAVPAEVTARILPKTLFGEKYVELVPPGSPSGQMLAAGAVIGPDRSAVGTELETVLDDVYPLLRTIRPARLNATLDAMATALEGRGERLGDNLERLNRYLTALEPHVSTMTHDTRALADVADIYREATPDLMRLLEHTTKTGRTVVLEERALEDFLTQLSTTSTTTREFLEENEADLIRLGEVSRPTLGLLATYSPEYPCLLEGMADWIPRFEDAFGRGEHFEGSAPSLHITLELVPQQRGYSRDDRPVFGDDRGPGCRGLPHPPWDQEDPAPGNDVETGIGSRPGPGSRAPVFDTTSGYAGTEAEQQIIDALVAPVMRRTVDDVP